LAFYKFLQKKIHVIHWKCVPLFVTVISVPVNHSVRVCTCEVVRTRSSPFTGFHFLLIPSYLCSSHCVLNTLSTYSAPPASNPYYQIFPYNAALKEALCHCCMHGKIRPQQSLYKLELALIICFGYWPVQSN